MKKNNNRATETYNAWLKFFNEDSVKFIDELQFNPETHNLDEQSYLNLVMDLQDFRDMVSQDLEKNDFQDYSDEQLDEMDRRLQLMYNAFLFAITASNCTKKECEEIIEETIGENNER